MFRAVVVGPTEADRVPVDMRGVLLTTDAEVRTWLFGTPDTGGKPGYLKTHPELEGCQIQVEEVDN